MKKILLILTILAGVSLESEGQHFVTSFGVTQSWSVPACVNHVVYDNYYGYEWVHTSRINQRGRVFFNVLLQRGDTFVELNIGNRGRIYRTRYLDYYPFNDHVCNNVCGYNSVYYDSHYNACNSHHHRGHNHVVYNRRPAVYSYRRTYYKPRGHAHGYKKGHHKHKYKSHAQHDDDDYHDDDNDDNYRGRSHRISHSSGPSPRQRNYSGRSRTGRGGR